MIRSREPVQRQDHLPAAAVAVEQERAAAALGGDPLAELPRRRGVGVQGGVGHVPVSVTARRATKGVESPPPGRGRSRPVTDGREGAARGGSGHAPNRAPDPPRRGGPRRRSRLRPRPSTSRATGRSPTACRPRSTATGTTRPASTRASARARTPTSCSRCRSPRGATTAAPPATTGARAGSWTRSWPRRRSSRPLRRRWKDAQTHAPGFVSLDAHGQAPTSTSWSTARSSTASATRGSPGASSASRSAQARAIADRIHRTAMGSYWRWPAIRLNQINWYALVYAANATVTGSPRLLRHDLRLQIERFVARARGSAGVAGNLGPGPALQLPAAPAPAGADEHRLGGVREHHRVVHARVRPGPPGRHARAVARRPAAAARAG